MHTIESLLTTHSHIEAAFDEIWQQLDEHEQESIASRMEKLYSHGLPFELAEDRSLYTHLFSGFTLIEAIRAYALFHFPIDGASTEFSNHIRRLMIDKLFNALAFNRIVREVNKPQSIPQIHHNSFRHFVYLLNSADRLSAILYGTYFLDAMPEEMYPATVEAGVATPVFSHILASSVSPLSDEDLLAQLKIDTTKKKIAHLESLNLTVLSKHQSFTLALTHFVTVEKSRVILDNINDKFDVKTKRINYPKMNTKAITELFALNPRLYNDKKFEIKQLPTSHMRRFLMTTWGEPTSPLMTGQFRVDISELNYFDSELTSAELNLILAKSMAYVLRDYPILRRSLLNQRFYEFNSLEIAMIVRLPVRDEDELGMITFEDCRGFSISDMVRSCIAANRIMRYCYNRFKELCEQCPEYLRHIDDFLFDNIQPATPHAVPPPAYIVVSNMIDCNFDATSAPLAPGTPMSFNMNKVETSPVWNKKTRQFEPKDYLMMSVNADHRVLNGGHNVPGMSQRALNAVLQELKDEKPSVIKPSPIVKIFIKNMEALIKHDIQLAFHQLFINQRWVTVPPTWLHEMHVPFRLARKLKKNAGEFINS